MRIGGWSAEYGSCDLSPACSRRRVERRGRRVRQLVSSGFRRGREQLLSRRSRHLQPLFRPVAGGRLAPRLHVRHQSHRRGRDRPGAGRTALSVLMMTGTSDDYGRPTGRNVTMYEDQYGLSGRPFALTPDPRFWFATATPRKALAYPG